MLADTDLDLSGLYTIHVSCGPACDAWLSIFELCHLRQGPSKLPMKGKRELKDCLGYC